MPYVIHIKLFKLFQYFKFQVGTRVFWFKNPRLDSAGAVRVWAVFQDSSGARSITIGDFKHLRSVYLPFSIIGAAFICPHTPFFCRKLALWGVHMPPYVRRLQCCLFGSAYRFCLLEPSNSFLTTRASWVSPFCGLSTLVILVWIIQCSHDRNSQS